MKEINTCLICGSSQSKPFLVCKDYTVSQKEFTIRQCGSCGFKFTSPRPYDQDLGGYYKAESYISHSDTKKGLVNTLYHWVRSYTLIKKLQLVMHYTGLKQGKILDYGAGTGAFLEICKKNKWETYGIEPDETARHVMEKKFSISSYDSIHEITNDSSFKEFNVVTAWHVFEHVPDLKETIEILKGIMKERSVLIVAVPNPTSHDAAYYKEHWAAYDVPRHLWHFAPADMIRLMKDQGFKHIKTLPMAFDSFYVSMLSEKYKRGSSGLIKAFWRGLVSNIKAGKTGTEYSSQVYIFRKE
ncbi:MAG TPA: class I SAM-dependent methyltransferase, partial [Bacteroidia bacterium]|jgi:2-polyprenyl-3-methyl-5-hydroxy-6-metoxy-1,4-benzoquinol methylase|nr:class I SAM-dependent methyltransferase [Bacteroidia bacterium]